MEENQEAWISDMSPAIPICIILVNNQENKPRAADEAGFYDAVKRMTGAMAIGTLNVDTEPKLVTSLNTNALHGNGKRIPKDLPHWRLYHKGQIVAELPKWPKFATLKRLLDIKKEDYGWKLIVAHKPARGTRAPALSISPRPPLSGEQGAGAMTTGGVLSAQSDGQFDLESSGFAPGASGGASGGGGPGQPSPDAPAGNAFKPSGGSAFSGGAFRPPDQVRKVGGKMSLDNMLSGSEGGLPAEAQAGSSTAAAGGDVDLVELSDGDNDAPADSVEVEGPDGTAERKAERKRKRKEKKRKEKSDKKKKRRHRSDENSKYKSLPAGGGKDENKGAANHDDGTSSPGTAKVLADIGSTDSGSAGTAKDHSQDHVVQPKTKRPGVPQRAASVAAEAAAAGVHAKDPKRRKDTASRPEKKRASPMSRDSKAVYFPDNEAFFHCRTGSVVRREESRLVDSDDEVDTQWIRKQNEELIDEFVDVSTTEKSFMKLWNEFVMENAPYSDYYVANKCIQFSTSFAGRLVDERLRQCLLMHLFSLWDVGLVDAEAVDECMTIYDAHAEKSAGGGETKAAATAAASAPSKVAAGITSSPT